MKDFRSVVEVKRMLASLARKKVEVDRLAR
jgi:hypothetical protein